MHPLIEPAKKGLILIFALVPCTLECPPFSHFCSLCYPWHSLLRPLLPVVFKVEQTPSPDTGKCSQWKMRFDWLKARDVAIDIIDVPEMDYFGIPEGPRICSRSDESFDIPLRFKDKQTIAVTIENVYMEGAGGVMYTDCEVYAPIGLQTDIPRQFVGSADETVVVEDPVISLMHQSITNYYHWTAEGLSRTLISAKHFLGPDGAAPDAKFLVPQQELVPRVWDALETLDLPSRKPHVIYAPARRKRYFFKKLYFVTWVQLDKDDPDQNDLWSDYLPPRLGLNLLRSAADRIAAKSKGKLGQNTIVYVGRKGVREVKNEDILTDLLKKLLGSHFVVFNVDNKVGETLEDHINYFKNTKVILGPHGAGLTNMVYADHDASVVEFPMDPNCHGCFGYIAVVPKVDYWVVVKYDMTRRLMETLTGVLMD
eukprot:m.188814 g.188814  ORF g.188814 m.188814 type:complete len:426 (+) comp25649_c1_seq17:1169-2446(+)